MKTIKIGSNAIEFPDEIAKLSYVEFKKKYNHINFGAIGIDRVYTRLTGKETSVNPEEVQAKNNTKNKGD